MHPPFFATPRLLIDQRFIDMGAARVNVAAMEPDELFSKRADDPVSQVVRQDIDRLSVDELEARIATLEAEIIRCRSKISSAVNHRATADSLFKK